MSEAAAATPPARSHRPRWSELWLKEDWWAIWIGLGIVLAGWLLFRSGGSLRWLAAIPPKWSSPAEVADDLRANWVRYVAQAAFWAAAFGIAVRAMGLSLRRFLPGFALLYAAAWAILVVGQWQLAAYYNIEAPLLALFAGLVVANSTGTPRSLSPALRVEFYVKTGVVLLGATVPLSLIALAGPIAILQASIVSLITFGTIFWTGKRLGLDRRFAAVLGVGGAVCGVSAAIAIAGAVGARKEQASVTITAVVLWAVAMIFALPLAARALGLPTGVAGAWIGTSEFADAAGMAAAQAYGGYAGQVPGIIGTEEQAVQAFTLMKVVGRDAWIGIWAFVLAIVAATRWEPQPAGSAPDAGEIWRRFPKFVLGFLLASLLVSAATAGMDLPTYNRVATPQLIAPIKDLRSWAFVFCFLSIGLTTRFGDLAAAGRRPMAAFAAGVLVNVAIGYLLSVHVFGAHWAALGQ